MQLDTMGDLGKKPEKKRGDKGNLWVIITIRKNFSTLW